jgi:hypothetical protein
MGRSRKVARGDALDHVGGELSICQQRRLAERSYIRVIVSRCTDRGKLCRLSYSRRGFPCYPAN